MKAQALYSVKTNLEWLCFLCMEEFPVKSMTFAFSIQIVTTVYVCANQRYNSPRISETFSNDLGQVHQFINTRHKKLGKNTSGWINFFFLGEIKHIFFLKPFTQIQVCLKNIYLKLILPGLQKVPSSQYHAIYNINLKD